jgi:hypothetical protein
MDTPQAQQTTRVDLASKESIAQQVALLHTLPAPQGG